MSVASQAIRKRKAASGPRKAKAKAAKVSKRTVK